MLPAHRCTAEDVEAAASRLQVWAFPLVFAQRVRLNLTLPLTPDAPRPSTSAGAPLNRFGHQRALSDPGLAVGVAPNVDTLYSVAWVDLDSGSCVLQAPDHGDRYYSVQVALADTSSPWALGRRTHGGQLPEVHLRRGELGSRERGDRVELSTPHRYLMLCCRTMVEPDDPADLARAHRLQDGLLLTRHGPGGPGPVRRVLPGATDAELATTARAAEVAEAGAFRRALAAVVRDLAPAAVPRRVLQDIATCGLGEATDGPLPADAVERGLADGLARIEAHVRRMGSVVNGWALDPRGPDVGDDHLLRAAIAFSQIFINPPEEAVYPVCEVDDTGAPLDGRRGEYTWTLAADDLPPVDAFWSLTVYHRAGLLVANDLGRYAVGDRTPGVRPDAAGRVTVRVSATPPAAAAATWLPAPEGPFRLMLRLYVPRDTAWAPPPVVRVR